MLATITAPYADTRADDLRLSLTQGALPAEASREHRVGDLLVQLRVLRASHQVVVRRGDDVFVETLACLPDDPARDVAVVGTHRHCDARGEYEARIDVCTYDAADYAAEVTRLHLEYAADDSALIGQFPGDPLALTALRLDGDAAECRWRTFHAYPQERRVVYSASTFRPMPLAAAVPAAAHTPRRTTPS